MKVLRATAWNCFIGWLASIVFFFIVGFPIGSSTKGLTPILFFAFYSGLIISGVGLPLASLAYRRLSQRRKTPHPAVGLGIGVTVSQIVLLSVGGIYLCLIVGEDGPRILWSLAHSMYDGSSSIFAAAGAITGGLIGFLTACDLRAESGPRD
jgi:uncharacterized membrane protein YhaH (DUF805 family)